MLREEAVAVDGAAAVVHLAYHAVLRQHPRRNAGTLLQHLAPSPAAPSRTIVPLDVGDVLRRQIHRIATVLRRRRPSQRHVHRDLYANNHADVKLDAELSRENLCGN